MSQETERYQLENNGNTYLARASASGGGADVEANPEGTATTDLTKLKVDDTIYGIPEGTEVVANPTLAGTESALTGLQVGDTKYVIKKIYHTYTAGKTYTPSDTDYAQLVEDITLGREIVISNKLFYMVSHPTTDIWRYSSMMPDGGSNNHYACYLLTIEKNGDNYQIYGLSTVTISTVGVSSTAINYSYMPTISIGNSLFAMVGTQTAYTTTAPTADNTSGFLQIVVLPSEPATRYNGYLYIITA